jgi:hypothetical protein
VQLTDSQITRTLAALPGGCHATLAGDLARVLSALPEVRTDVVAEVRARLDAGEQPSSEDVAARILGRVPEAAAA